MKILLIFLPILALPLARLNAIGITLNEVWLGNSLNGSQITYMEMPASTFSGVRITDAVPFFPTAFNNLDLYWNYTNSTQQAVFDGNWFLRGGQFSASAILQFTLTEPVSYLVTGNVRNHDNLASDFASMNATIGFGDSPFDLEAAAFSSSARSLATILVFEPIFRRLAGSFSRGSISLKPTATAIVRTRMAPSR